MNTQPRVLWSLLLLFLLLIPYSYANAYDIKPDITKNIQQQEPLRWNRKHCCYPATPYDAAKTVIEDKLLATEQFLKLSDLLNSFWEKQTHQ